MTLPKWLEAVWYGMRLICPRCHEGRIYRSFTVRNEKCPVCGAEFEAEQGNFLGSMFLAYTGTVIFIGVPVLILGILTDFSLANLLTIGVVASSLFLLLFYRNMRGIWLGILYLLTDFKPIP